jgi:hypothetical protein
MPADYPLYDLACCTLVASKEILGGGGLSVSVSTRANQTSCSFWFMEGKKKHAFNAEGSSAVKHSPYLHTGNLHGASRVISGGGNPSLPKLVFQLEVI